MPELRDRHAGARRARWRLSLPDRKHAHAEVHPPLSLHARKTSQARVGSAIQPRHVRQINAIRHRPAQWFGSNLLLALRLETLLPLARYFLIVGICCDGIT